MRRPSWLLRAVLLARQSEPSVGIVASALIVAILIVNVNILVAPPEARGQPAAKPYRVGLLMHLAPPPEPATVAFLEAVRQGLNDEGLVEGTNVAVEARYETDTSALRQHATALVAAKVDAVLTFSTPATHAAAAATRVTPIIFTAVSDPIGSGFVQSLSRPDRNITGISNVFPDVTPRLLQFLRDAVPSLTRAAVLWNRDNPGKQSDFAELKAAADKAGITLRPYGIRAAGDIPQVLELIAGDRPEGLITLVDAVTFYRRAEIARFALERRIPTAFNSSGHVEVGALLSYSPEMAAMYRRAGVLVGRILKGTRPADLPVERPTTFRFAINLKTAKALGLTIPSALRVAADQVIE